MVLHGQLPELLGQLGALLVSQRASLAVKPGRDGLSRKAGERSVETSGTQAD